MLYTIDGNSGTGKTTIAKYINERIGGVIINCGIEAPDAETHIKQLAKIFYEQVCPNRANGNSVVCENWVALAYSKFRDEHDKIPMYCRIHFNKGIPIVKKSFYIDRKSAHIPKFESRLATQLGRKIFDYSESTKILETVYEPHNLFWYKSLSVLDF